MSVPVYILTDSGEWFRLNELHGEGWCLSFDENAVFAVVQRKDDEPVQQTYLRGVRLLCDAGFRWEPEVLYVPKREAVSFVVRVCAPIPRGLIPDGMQPAKFSPPGVLLHFGDHEAAERFAAESNIGEGAT